MTIKITSEFVNFTLVMYAPACVSKFTIFYHLYARNSMQILDHNTFIYHYIWRPVPIMIEDIQT